MSENIDNNGPDVVPPADGLDPITQLIADMESIKQQLVAASAENAKLKDSLAGMLASNAKLVTAINNAPAAAPGPAAAPAPTEVDMFYQALGVKT